MNPTQCEPLKTGPYECTLINGIQGDPGVYCFSPRTGEACLFDAGMLEGIGNREILKSRHVFITHAHIDHFIGFDRILRVNIPHGREINCYGPAGFAKNVQGKVRGFLWNLLEPGQLKFKITEVFADGTLALYSMSNDDGFELHENHACHSSNSNVEAPLPLQPACVIARLSDGSRVEAVILDHSTPVVGYMIQGPKSFHLKQDTMIAMGLTPGAWISHLQNAILTLPAESSYELAGKGFILKDLSEMLFTSSMSRPFAYLTDFIFNADNLKRLKSTMSQVETLYCETTFRDEDYSRAQAKKHLTTRQAALIARLLDAKVLRAFHISNIYSGSADDSLKEAEKFFSEALNWSEKDLELAINQELARNQLT